MTGRCLYLKKIRRGQVCVSPTCLRIDTPKYYFTVRCFDEIEWDRVLRKITFSQCNKIYFTSSHDIVYQLHLVRLSPRHFHAGDTVIMMSPDNGIYKSIDL